MATNEQQQPFRPSPIVQLALQYLLGSDPKHRQDLAELVCDTLGVSPRFWREAPDAPPLNVACLVRLTSAPPSPVYTVATWNGARWAAFNDSTIEGVAAWAAIPD